MRHRRFRPTFFLSLVTGVLVPWLAAHDLQTRIESKPPFVILHASYEGQQPASFLSVTVHPPASAQVKADAYQTGHTDFYGRFVFQPSAPGDWRLIVDDEMGHRVELVTAVSPDSETAHPRIPSGNPPAGEGRSTAERLLIGLSILFGAAGLLYGWTARKRSSRTR